ncbi:hypothetical protein ACIKP9_07065 [Methylobacillus methanolivorans]|uniref:Uncharacterized protein n=1 Tax=Methylobacillus methanolivorans TaxID=1848927 RepID=A0ABW8GLD8_9PROT
MNVLRVCFAVLVVAMLSSCCSLNEIDMEDEIAEQKANIDQQAEKIKELEQEQKNLKKDLSNAQKKAGHYDAHIAHAYFCDYQFPFCDSKAVEGGREAIASGQNNLTFTRLLLAAAVKTLLWHHSLVISLLVGFSLYLYIIHPKEAEIKKKLEIEANHEGLVKAAKLEHEQIVAAIRQEQLRNQELQLANNQLIENRDYYVQIIIDQEKEIEDNSRRIEELRRL